MKIMSGKVLAQLPVTDLRHVLFEVTMYRYAKRETAMYPYFKNSSPEKQALKADVIELKNRNSMLMR